MIGYADGNGFKPSCDEIRKTAVRAPVHDERQRPRPEALCQSPCKGGDMGELFSFSDARHVDNERIKSRTAFGFENARHGLPIGGIGTEAINRLCWKRDEFAATQCRCGRLQCVWAWGDDRHNFRHSSWRPCRCHAVVLALQRIHRRDSTLRIRPPGRTPPWPIRLQ